MKLSQHLDRVKTSKIILALIAVILVTYLVIGQFQAQERSNASVAAHTQTLDQIKTLATEIKALDTEIKDSNAIDHNQTINDINCIFLGIIALETDPSATQAQQTDLVNQCKATAEL